MCGGGENWGRSDWYGNVCSHLMMLFSAQFTFTVDSRVILADFILQTKNINVPIKGSYKTLLTRTILRNLGTMKAHFRQCARLPMQMVIKTSKYPANSPPPPLLTSQTRISLPHHLHPPAPHPRSVPQLSGGGHQEGHGRRPGEAAGRPAEQQPG